MTKGTKIAIIIGSVVVVAGAITTIVLLNKKKTTTTTPSTATKTTVPTQTTVQDKNRVQEVGGKVVAAVLENSDKVIDFVSGVFSKDDTASATGSNFTINKYGLIEKIQ